MKQTKKVLAINTGSSSIKFSLYNISDAEELVLTGSLTRIGYQGGEFAVMDQQRHVLESSSVAMHDHESACDHVFSWIRSQGESCRPDAAGHRMVSGGRSYSTPEVATSELIASLEELIPYAPEHLPQALTAVRYAIKLFPDILQVTCFDTAFHSSMPAVAKLYPFPEPVRRSGIQRYGFHGLSYEYLLGELERRNEQGGSQKRIILAHLGHGSSMAAVFDGKSIDTTMGFSPAGGLVMSTRTGDLDPGVLLFLMQQEKMNPREMNAMINRHAGLLGISGVSDDMQVLLSMQQENSRVREAIDLFCYRAKQWIGSYAAVMGGLDTLVFSGGIGEHAGEIRSRICEGLGFLGIAIDPSRNLLSSPVISPDGNSVSVRVIKTNEELMIARHTFKLLTGA
jgi:acetate kinase